MTTQEKELLDHRAPKTPEEAAVLTVRLLQALLRRLLKELDS